MQTFQIDLVTVGTGGAGLRVAIAVAQANPNAKITLISEVYPIRSHTVVTKGGSVAVAQDHDSFEHHLHGTITGDNRLCERDVVDYLVYHCPIKMTQPELWGCSWSRRPGDSVNACRFGDMKIECTWFAADKTNLHMLYALFRAPPQFPQIQRFGEHFVLDILVDDGHVRDLVTMDTMEDTLVQIRVNTAVMATGGVGRVYRYNTNGGIATDDGVDVALSHGVSLHDMEFIQCHPTDLPDPGILVTEGCRGEGGILVNKNGCRYLQDYGMGLETPLGEPKNKYMELGPRDKVSQAFWHEWRKDNTISTSRGDVVHLDLRHLGEKKLHERLPFTCKLAKAYIGVGLVKEPVPVRPTARCTMGGIGTDQNCETRIKGLLAMGECSSVGLHGANRLGSNPLVELAVFGRLAGEQTTERTATAGNGNEAAVGAQAADVGQRLEGLVNQDGGENWTKIRDEMDMTMEEGYGIYRTPELMQKIIDKLVELWERFKRVRITGTSSVFSTDLLYTIELGRGLDVAECMAYSAMVRKESRDAYQHLDEGCTECDSVNFFKHTLALRDADGTTRLEYGDVKVTTLPPTKRVYGGEADAADKAETANKKEKAND